MAFLSLPLYKGQIITKLADNGGYRFPRVSRHCQRGSQVGNGKNGRKWISAGKWQKMDFRVISVIPLLMEYIEFTQNACFCGR